MLILFRARQQTLITPPKLVVETTKMAVWKITLLPGEHVICDEEADVDFVRSLSIGRVAIIDANNQKFILDIFKDTLVTSETINPDMGDIVKLENISTLPISFMTVEQNEDIEISSQESSN